MSSDDSIKWNLGPNLKRAQAELRRRYAEGQKRGKRLTAVAPIVDARTKKQIGNVFHQPDGSVDLRRYANVDDPATQDPFDKNIE